MKLMSLAVAASAVALLAGCGTKGGSSTASAPAPAAQSAAISMPDGPGRDWTKVDTTRDGYVSPAEMEAWLKANPGPAKK